MPSTGHGAPVSEYSTVKSPSTPLDTIGAFWPAARSEVRLPGRLTFDPSDGGRLEVVGSFRDPREVLANTPRDPDGSVTVGLSRLFGHDDPPMRILGDTKDGPVTLHDCLATHSQVNGRTTHGTYHVPLVLAGIHIPDREPLLFNEAEFTIPRFARWSRTSGLGASVIVRKDSWHVEKIRITYTRLPEATVGLPNGRLSLYLPYRLYGDHISESAIEQTCTLNLQFTAPCGLVGVLEAHHALEALLSIAVNAAVHVAETRVQAKAEPWLRLHRRGIGAGAHAGEVPRSRAHDVLFTYSELGGLSGLARWLTMSAKFWPAIAPLLSRWYAPDLYDELQFFNMVSAAEAFYRIRRRTRRRVPLERMLKALAKVAGTPFQSMVGDVDTWAQQVALIRHQYIVHRVPGVDADGERLYWLTASLYILVVLCLLRECVVPEENLPKPESATWMATIARRLAAIGWARPVCFRRDSATGAREPRRRGGGSAGG